MSTLVPLCTTYTQWHVASHGIGFSTSLKIMLSGHPSSLKAMDYLCRLQKMNDPNQCYFGYTFCLSTLKHSKLPGVFKSHGVQPDHHICTDKALPLFGLVIPRAARTHSLSWFLPRKPVQTLSVHQTPALVSLSKFVFLDRPYHKLYMDWGKWMA